MSNENINNAASGSNFSGQLLEEYRLQSIINDRSSEIHRIDEDIEKLEQALVDIDQAIASFRKAADDMQVIETEVALVFRGESAVAFMRKIEAYKNYCLHRIEHMNVLKTNYKKQIKDLELQKTIAQNLLSILRERLDRLRKSRICIM